MTGSYNKVRDIKAGLEIFERRGGTHCAAGHDVFYAGQAPRRAGRRASPTCPNLPRVGNLHMTIDEYLSSPTAIEDFGRWQYLDSPWMLDHEGGWQRAWCNLCPDHIAYYRLEGERYVVTDLGEAVHAQRLRTGRLIPYVRVPFVEFAEIGPAGLIYAISDKTDGTLRSPDSWIYQGVLPTVTSTDLPRAICAVLLAAHRVANLNPGGGS